MNLHEYQAKEIFREYGIPVSKGMTVVNSGEITKVINSLKGKKWVVKAQVHAGGRGKAGGVELVNSVSEVEEFTEKWLGKNLVTYQTDEKGQPVNTILIEEFTDIDKELYLGAVIDRESQRLVFMTSSEGGVNIEEVASTTPEKIFQVAVDPLNGPSSNEADYLSTKLNLTDSQKLEFQTLYLSLTKMFIEKDLSLLEINPLVINAEGNLICLDAKINVDSNALYRQESLVEINDISQEDEREAHQLSALFSEAYKFVLENYVDKASLNPEKLIEGALDGMFEALGDPYSSYVAPDQVEKITDLTTGEFSGVGMYIAPRSSGGVEVIAPIEGQPAHRAGVRTGDIIISINGESTTGYSIEDVILRLRGEPGSSVAISFALPCGGCGLGSGPLSHAVTIW